MNQLSKRTSGKAATALSQPQQTATAKKQPTAEQIEQALNGLVEVGMEQYCSNLAIARSVYRGNPKLVASKTTPEPWRSIATTRPAFPGREAIGVASGC